MIVVVPGAIPATTPVTASIVATDSSLLLHSPPVVAELNDAVLPAHIAIGPAIAAGVAPVVTVIELKQPVAEVYVILVVPALTPVTSPVPASTVAFDVLLLVHVPPAGEELNAVAAPAHTCASPPIADGISFTVTSRLTAQPVAGV
jgi:hypothetical protein